MTAKEQFPDRPDVVAYLPWEEKSGLWYFNMPFRFFSRFGPGVIHAGFETDFGSIPPFLRGVVDDDDPKALCPYLRHDARYDAGLGERADWDLELYEGLIDCGMSRIKAWLVHRAVRARGGSRWKTKTS